MGIKLKKSDECEKSVLTKSQVALNTAIKNVTDCLKKNKDARQKKNSSKDLDNCINKTVNEIRKKLPSIEAKAKKCKKYDDLIGPIFEYIKNLFADNNTSIVRFVRQYVKI